MTRTEICIKLNKEFDYLVDNGHCKESERIDYINFYLDDTPIQNLSDFIDND